MPVVRSATSKPSRLFVFANTSVCLPLMVNGRTTSPNGPICLETVWVFASVTVMNGGCRPWLAR